MNIKKFALTFFISLFVVSYYTYAQEIPEINEDFLNSLPEDIKADLIEKNAQQNLSTEKNYRPYLYSSKLSLLKKKKRKKIMILRFLDQIFLIHFKLPICQSTNLIQMVVIYWMLGMY